jgi:hypothetical protein
MKPPYRYPFNGFSLRVEDDYISTPIVSDI